MTSKRQTVGNNRTQNFWPKAKAMAAEYQKENQMKIFFIIPILFILNGCVVAPLLGSLAVEGASVITTGNTLAENVKSFVQTNDTKPEETFNLIDETDWLEQTETAELADTF